MILIPSAVQGSDNILVYPICIFCLAYIFRINIYIVGYNFDHVEYGVTSHILHDQML